MSNPKLLKADSNALRAAFYNLHFPSHVAALLEMKPAQLAYYLKDGSEGHYRLFEIPKKSGDSRQIAAPSTPLKLVQQKLNEVLNAVYEPRDAAQGFVRGRSILHNARKHVRKRWVLNLDLQDFFPSIHFGRVRGLFMATPFHLPADAATMLARICCYRSRLPQGAPTSPIVSNMICQRLDKQLSRLAERCKCVYTRYADDITISTSLHVFPIDIARLRAYPATPETELGTALTDVIASNGFAVNRRKVRLRKYNRRQEVTGLTVNQFPNVSRRFLRRLEAMLHAWEKHGYENAESEFHEQWDAKLRHPEQGEVSFRRVVEGNLEFLRMVRGYAAVYTRLHDKYARLVRQAPDHALWVVETSQRQGTAFALEGYGLITCAHVVTAAPVRVWQPDAMRQFSATVAARNSELDLAVLEIDEAPEHWLTRAPGQRLRRGESVRLLGFPKYNPGQQVQEFSTTVSGFGRRHGTDRFFIVAPIFDGNSGGPVLNDANEVVGIAVTGVKDPDPEDDNEYGVIRIYELDHLMSSYSRGG